MRIVCEVEVAAPPHVVYAVVTDIARWTQFVRAIEQLDILTPGVIGVGTRFRETRKMLGRSATEEMTVTVMESPTRFDLTAENHGTRYLVRHVILAEGTGSRLRLIFDGTAVTFAAKLGLLIGIFFIPAVKRQLATDLKDIKAEAERRANG